MEEITKVIPKSSTTPMSPEDLTGVSNVLMKLIESKKLPSHIKTVEDAFIVRQFGKELGIEFLQAAHHIYPVNGRLTISTAGMSALLRRSGVKWKTLKDAEKVLNEKGEAVDVVTVIEFYRDGIAEQSSFSYKDAITADLTGKDVWKKYLKAMLWARAFSQGARRVASDCLMGLTYTTEELDQKGQLLYDEEGNPIIQ
jgi:hypothetical protein